MGTGRKLLAAACAFAPASLLVYAHPTRPGLLAYAALLAVAGVGLGLRSMAAQVVSRGILWTSALPGAFATIAMLTDGRLPSPLMVALGAGASASLLLGRPMLHTDAAREAFAPLRHRGWLLAGCSAAVSVALYFGAAAFALLRHGRPGGFLAFAVALALGAAAVGVARMRAWGILLAGLTSSVALAAGLAWHDPRTIFAGLLATVPGLLLCLPILAARLLPPKRVEEVRLRVAAASAEPGEAEAMSGEAPGIRLREG
jgi:hypothetical protein